MGNERFRCPEALFKPCFPGSVEMSGIHEATYFSAMNLELNLRKLLLGNVMLSGGTTMLPGIVDRLQKEIQALLPPDIRVMINSPGERRYRVWTGGSILANMSAFQRKWIFREEYRDAGPQIVHRKCT